MKLMRQPNNNAIALMIGLNILVSTITLFNVNGTPDMTTKAYAQTIEEPNQKVNEENKVDTKEEDIIFNVESVTQSNAKVNTIPLYFSHATDHGTFFTYTKTDEPKTWEQGYWYIDYNTLFLANINPTLLRHNDEIQGVFYPSIEGNVFEIKEVVAKSKSYSLR